MTADRQPEVALVWSQFAAYHLDRCEAATRQLAGRAAVTGIEVATSSATYAWEPAGNRPGVRTRTLFPGRSYDALPGLRRIGALLSELRRYDAVFCGIPSNEPAALALWWLLPLAGVRVYAMSESKFDDRPRAIGRDILKAVALLPCRGMVVGATRHHDYYRYLGFRRRRVLPGYDGVGVERIRAEAAGVEPPAFAARPFVYVGRFVAKKNLLTLVDAYADYVARAGEGARRLVLAGSGELEADIRERVSGHGLDQLVDFPGFLPAEAVSRLLAGAIALVLVSREEQWGLVVNEALAAGVPAIVSDQVGARDALVRNLVEGFTVPDGSVAAITAALLAIGADEARWQAMAAAAGERAWLGDAGRFADAVELLLFPGAEPAASRMAGFASEIGLDR